MQLHNILIIDYPGLSPAVRLSENDSVIRLAGSSITSRLTDFLSSSQIPRGTGINLILDFAFIRYQYFNFPKTSVRRLRQMLPFELDDSLLKGAENYEYSFVTKTFKNSEITTAGIYIIEKQLLDELLSIFRLFNLELRCLSSIENLLDLTYRESSHRSGNEIWVDLNEDQTSARFFSYRNGFLTAISALPDIEIPSDGSEHSNSQFFVERLNKVINAIRLSQPDFQGIAVSGNLGHHISVNDHQFVSSGDNSTPKRAVNMAEVRLDHPRRINLIQSNFLIIQELKKHSRSLGVIAGVLLFSLALYISIVTYQGYTDHAALQALEQRLTQTISKHLPANSSKSNAEYVLKERIQNLETERKKQEAFEQRRYQVAQTLADISMLKEEVPSLILNRFSLNDQVIRFQGKTASLEDFDRLQEEILKLFPADNFRINTNEKSLMDGSIDFTTTIQDNLFNR